MTPTIEIIGINGNSSPASMTDQCRYMPIRIKNRDREENRVE